MCIESNSAPLRTSITIRSSWLASQALSVAASMDWGADSVVEVLFEEVIISFGIAWAVLAAPLRMREAAVHRPGVRLGAVRTGGGPGGTWGEAPPGQFMGRVSQRAARRQSTRASRRSSCRR